MSVNDALVSVVRLSRAAYPVQAPFHPARHFPEQPSVGLGPANEVYEGVRQLFYHLGFDAENFGTSEWNPLREMVHPGDTVVVKPNLLWHSHKYRPQEWQQVITHGSVVRAVVDYICLALAGRGEICIADGPQLDADWEQILLRTGLREVADSVRQRWPIHVHLLDLRDSWIDRRGDVDYGAYPLPGDPAGTGVVDVGRHSMFCGFGGEGRYYGADYDFSETNLHHCGELHEYRIAKTILDCDVLVNIPKLKTHKKVGVTLALKNLVGVNVSRNWLPHYTTGSPNDGGDQFAMASMRAVTENWGMRMGRRVTRSIPRLAPAFRLAKRVALPVWGSTQATVRSGNWHGNDTCWRMVHDINRAVLWGSRGQYPARQPRRTLVVVDGVIAGEGDGPETPDAVEAGMLVGGVDAVAVDSACAKLMGFDPMRLSLLREAFQPSDLPLTRTAYERIAIEGNLPAWTGRLADVPWSSTLHFRPHFGWKGHIEGSDEAVI